MEENGKRLRDGGAGGVSGKRARIPTPSEDENDRSSGDEGTMAWLFIDDESMSELAKLLETEVTLPVRVKFIDDPYSSTLIFQSSSSYITINGNEESCGSSFSDTESSVMASVDTRGIDIGRRGGCWEEGRAWGVCEAVARGGEEVKGTDGCDLCQVDDEMLAKFIGEDLFA